MPNEPMGLLLADDLLWTSRISGTAQALGVSCLTARTADRLVELARQHQPACVILDLGMSGVKAAELVEAIRAAVPVAPRFVAYGSHVDTATLHAARAAGCDPVLPRSKMADGLPQLLSEWFGTTASARRSASD